MDLAGRRDSSSSRGGEGRLPSLWPFRTFAHGACHWRSNCHFAQDRKVSQVCRYFLQGFCFHGDQCSYQHPKPPGHLQWGRRHSELTVTLPGPLLRLPRRGSEPTYLPSVAVGWAGASWGTEPGLEQLTSQNEELGGTSRKFPSLSPAGGDHGHSQEPQPHPQPDAVRELVASLQSMDLEREQESRDIMCGICMDKVWDKPEAKRMFGILPNCTHAHCLSCLRTWRRSRQDFPLDVIKACPQCRVHSSYIIPHKFWVSKAAEKEELIRNFKSRTNQIPCRFFLRGKGRCPFKSDCIYLHQLQDKALPSNPPHPESLQLPSGSEVLGPAALLEDEMFTVYFLAMTFWGLELLLDPNSSYYSLQ